MGVVVVIDVLLAAIVLTGLAVTRWRVRRGGGRDRTASVLDVAYLQDGPRLVVVAVLAVLRRHGLVSARERGIVATADAELPAGASAAYKAILLALRRPQHVAGLLEDERVAAATAAIGARLVARGWLLSAGRQDAMRARGRIGWAAAVCYLVQVALMVPGFIGPAWSVRALVPLTLAVVVAVGTYLLVDVPPITHAGRAALRGARTSLRPGPGVQVVLDGEPALAKQDPRFARLAGAFDGKLADMPTLMTHGWLR